MLRTTRRAWLTLALVAIITVVVVTAGYSAYLASEAGVLPWQAEPTRIAVTPFANLPESSTAGPESTPTASDPGIFVAGGWVLIAHLLPSGRER